MKAESPAPALRVEGAIKRFGDRCALDGARLTVAPGEWIGLLGPNGAGKTTLMHAVAGLIRTDGGVIQILGTRLTRKSIAALRGWIGLVPQEVALYPLLTARENLATFGRLHGVESDLASRIDWALDWSGLTPRADERVETFSGGMQRRLNIACGVLHRPRIVLLDEPTVGVDPQARLHIMEMLAGLRREGAALVQSTHAFDEIEAVCDRMAIMDRGRIIADGTVAQLVAATVEPGAGFRLTIDRPAQGLDLGPGVQVEGRNVVGRLQDVALELPLLLEHLRRAGHAVHGLTVDAPGLESVFAELTGRELRE